jgi:hypothetical protein
MQLEAGLGMGQRQSGNGVMGGARLAGGRAEKLPARGCVEEQPPHSDRGPSLPGNRGDPLQSASDHSEQRAFTFSVVSAQREPGYRGDGRESFTAEAEGGHSNEIGGRPDLAGRMPVQRQNRVLSPHSGAVVADLDQNLSAVLQLHSDVTGTGVKCVFNQLLDHRGGTLDDFTRGDLIGHRVGEDGNVTGHRRNLPADRGDGGEGDPALPG